MKDSNEVQQSQQKKGKLHARLGVYGSVSITLLQDKRVKPNAVKVYIALSSFQGTKESAYPGYEAIAERAGVSKRAVATALSNLEKTGWIMRHRRGFGYNNTYVCLTYMDPVPEFKQKTRRGKSLSRTVSDKQMCQSMAHLDVPMNGATDVPMNGALYKRPVLKAESKSKSSAKQKRLMVPPKGVTTNRERIKNLNTIDKIITDKQYPAAGKLVIEHFLSTYASTMGSEHPVYKTKAWLGCMKQLSASPWCQAIDNWREMIEQYFRTPYPNAEVNYHAGHFFTDGVQEHLTYDLAVGRRAAG